MMKNGLFTASILTSAAMAACFSGCSTGNGNNTGGTTGGSSGSNYPSSSSGGVGSSTSSGSGSSSGSSSGANAGGTDAGACMPPAASIQSNDLPPYAPVMGVPNACTSMQISGFISNCVAAGATGNTCATWASSNTTCAGCIVQGTDAGATETGGILFNTMGRPVSGNIPGCIAIADSAGGAACAQALEPLVQCVALACSSCMDQASFSACEAASKASNGACASFASTADSSCSTDLADGGVALSKCGYGTPNELTDVLNVICGAGP